MGMNIFRLAGDLSHLTGILILLYRLTVSRNAGGMSRRVGGCVWAPLPLLVAVL
jgi:hypothetical protein